MYAHFIHAFIIILLLFIITIVKINKSNKQARNHYYLRVFYFLLPTSIVRFAKIVLDLFASYDPAGSEH